MNVFEVMEPEELRMASPLVLAWAGDCVYELFVRLALTREGGTHTAMHKTAVSYVNSAAQCRAYDIIKPALTDAEADAFRRGRNANTGSRPRHASPAEYAMATGFEALFGWLWLGGQRERARELFDMIWARRQELPENRKQGE